MTREAEQKFYICGRCKSKIFSLKDEEHTVPCPDCGWNRKEKDPYDVPAEHKIDLSQY